MIDKEKKRWRDIRSALRKIWLYYSDNRKEALNKAKVSRGKYRCNTCSKLFGPKQVEVDHVIRLGKLNADNLGDWVNNLMFGEMVVACKSCHNLKTQGDKRNDKTIQRRLSRGIEDKAC